MDKNKEIKRKEPSKKRKEKSVKLTINFEEAIDLALKTPPIKKKGGVDLLSP